MTSQVAIGLDGWRAAVDRNDPERSEDLWGAGPHLLLTPLADRPWAADPVLDFGVETVRLSNGEERSAAFVFGAGLRSRFGSRWSVEALARNRFLTVEEEPVDGVATGRDTDLGEIAVELTWTSGGHGL